MIDDQLLITRILSGDEQSFITLLSEYEARIFRLACRMVNERDAEDITQEAFVAVYKSLPTFNSRAKLSTWIYRVAINTCLMWRRSKAAETVSLDDAVELRSHSANPEQQAMINLEFEPVKAAIEKLDEPHRWVVVLHELHGFTYKEIGEMLEIPVGTVKSRLHHAFQQLRAALVEKTAGAH